ncbi:hypothetical protein MMC18_001716 [Xylographa bjoerkii]|nr:hypothetical protein [Xylographa bjoerkii]
MSKKQFKSQASSSRAASNSFGATLGSFGDGGFAAPLPFGAALASPLSYVYEPPDLSSISEPNVVVAFKNLQKKDSITKAKALEELQSYITSENVTKNGVEDPVLEAWILLYPRTSIDSSRRVRQLAHSFHGEVSLSCGKRIARQMPKVIGAWLAGFQDNDKLVARAAQEAFLKVFSTKSKQDAVWQVYQQVIINYCKRVILEEGVTTLSDERTTSPDVAEAKYARVVGTAICTIANALNVLSLSELRHQIELYKALAQTKSVWKLASHSDSFVRKAVYELICSLLRKRDLDIIDFKLISTNVLQEALHIDQTGSAYDYSKMLVELSEACRDVWTEYYTGTTRRSAQKRLCQFLSKGSQGGQPEFWKYISRLFELLPQQIIHPIDGETDTGRGSADQNPRFLVLDAIHDGINRRDEYQGNHGEAWRTYLNVAKLLFQSFLSPDSRKHFLETYVAPLMDQYIKPAGKGERWAVLGSDREEIFKNAISLILRCCPDLFERNWQELSNAFIQDLQLSLPGQSKDYTRSQDSVVYTAKRWYTLQAGLIKSSVSEHVQATFEGTSAVEITSAAGLLKSRNGKPYCAAASLEVAIRLVPETTIQYGTTKDLLFDFMRSDLPNLLLSSSSSYLIGMLSTLEGELDMRQIWIDSVQTLMNAPDSTTKFQALRSLISFPRLGNLGLSNDMVSVVKRSLQYALHGNESCWPVVAAAMANPCIPDNLTDYILASLTDSLSIENEAATGLHGLGLAIQQNEQSIRRFTTSPKGPTLLSKLLFLAESSIPSISHEARELDTKVRRANSSEGSSGISQSSRIDIIKNGVEIADPTSLSVASLESEAIELLRHAAESEVEMVADALLPDEAQWITVLKPYFQHHPDPALAITNSLGGALHMVVAQDSGTRKDLADPVPRDTNGYSPALRMAWYVTALCTSTDIFDIVTTSRRAITYHHMALFVQLATDQLSVPQLPGLWKDYDTEDDSRLINFIADNQSMVVKWSQKSSTTDMAFVKEARKSLLASTMGLSALAYYNGRAYTALASELEETSGITNIDENYLTTAQEASDPITVTVTLCSISNPETVLHTCNRLISDLIGLKFADRPAIGKYVASSSFSALTVKGLRKVVLLNTAIKRLQDFDHLEDLPQPRLVFFVKHIVSQVQIGAPSLPITAELYKALNVVLQLIKDIYGSFWEEIMSFVTDSCSRITQEKLSDIPFTHATLRLYDTFKRLATTYDENEDLAESWAHVKAAADESLIRLMQSQTSLSDEANQPRRIVNELLKRLLTKPYPMSYNTEEDLYPVIACESPALQHAAYEMLHKHIPENQEEVSIEAALSKTFTAKLPEELLSLILTVPQYDEPLTVDWEHPIPLPLKSYLLSWILVFDHWINASYKLQSDYVTFIKEGTYLNSLLSFAFDYLISSRAKPIDGSRYDPEHYCYDSEDQPERDASALIIHLYFLCLKNLPTLSKAWWRDTCPRHLQKPVEAWTEKYISPAVIAAELATVTAWLPTQDTTDTSLAVKVSSRAHELTASYPLDEQHMSIRIVLPPTYPLASVLVESVQRVGIDEKKWRSWLLTTAGVINFSGTSGAIIEGLVAWRNNVTGALKGQSECAICYSVVSADRQLPSKRCGTCRNLFHGSCLFRWFRSSGSSSCPLCRNAFNYG